MSKYNKASDINPFPDPICYVLMAKRHEGSVIKKRKNLQIQQCLQLLIHPDHDLSCQAL